MNLLAENLIIDSLNKKMDNVLKRFECKCCGQMYIYIVKRETNTLKCSICNSNIDTKGEV